MKHLTILAAALLLSLSAFAQSGKSIYQKYSDAENVSAVYISPAMFRMIGRLPDIDAGRDSFNLTSVIRSLSGLYILNSGNPAINGNLRADAQRFIDSGKYELLMEAKDRGQAVRLYTMGSEQIISGFALLSAEDDEVTFIFLEGQMPRREFEQLISKQLNL